MIVKAKNLKLTAPLFQNWDETLIWSCLQGIMGEIYIPDEENKNASLHEDSLKIKARENALPESAMAVLGDFCFLAGKPDRRLVSYKPEALVQEFVIMVPQSRGWSVLIEEHFGEKARKVKRYAIKKEMNVFDRKKLEQIVTGASSLPAGYSLQLIDEALYHQCKKEDWCRDLVSQYADYEMYRKYGLGVVVVKDGEIISGASSYSSYTDGIEIEIDTKKEHRGKGFALLCGAGLILECLDRNLYPSWDAQNLWSAALAEKLGYHYDHAYDAYEIWGWKSEVDG
ncbi:MAG: GNAT family N-acetyltransferase [Lachnospiraceae bacterium]|nr:GNAT family N-acetyltransferase [Lachnospiraceae bacterium]